jgi:hypothetical protein
MSDAEAWRAELQAHKRRLAILKEQAAIQGISRDPRLDIEIADIERQIADLQRKLGQIPDASSAPAEPPASAAQAPISAGRDAIVANISGSSRVAVGKQISQIDQVGAPAGPPDRMVIEQGLAALGSALEQLRNPDAGKGGQIDPALASMATFQIGLLGSELIKPASDTPSANTIVQVGDWLFANVPQLGAPLQALLAAPAVARVAERAGGAAPAWRARVASIEPAC